jgi:hypothetical protein
MEVPLRDEFAGGIQKFSDWSSGARTANYTGLCYYMHCIASLWVSLVTFVAIILCVVSQRVIPKVSVFFVTTQSGNFWIHRVCVCVCVCLKSCLWKIVLLRNIFQAQCYQLLMLRQRRVRLKGEIMIYRKQNFRTKSFLETYFRRNLNVRVNVYI